MNNKVKFLRGTATEYEASTKDNDTFYYTTDTKKLYLGETEITGIEIDDTSTTATDKTWSVKKISDSIPTSLPANGGNADTIDGKHYSDFVNYLGEITDVNNILNNPEYGDCSYEGVISSDVATSIGLPSVSISDKWSIKCFRATDGSGCQIAVPIYYNLGEPPKYRIAYKNHLSGSYIISWGNWKNISDDGNADTVDGLHANEIASNPNLLTNPDFRINQRGQTEYTTSVYTVDRWKTDSAKLTVNDSFITLENTTEKATAAIYQIVENPTALSGKTVVLSFDYNLKTEGAWISVQAVTNGSWNPSAPVQLFDTGRNVKSTVITLPENLTDLRLALVIHSTDSAPLAAVDIYGAKLELGEIATPIIPADPATELAKCQRYYQIRSTNDIDPVDLRPSMRATPTDIKQVTGGYAYVAEL